jgi:hypothetical protein
LGRLGVVRVEVIILMGEMVRGALFARDAGGMTLV